MKRFFRLFTILGLALILSVFAIACQRDSDDNGDNGDPVDSLGLEGDYEVDMTNLGMPMQIYLRIHENNRFEISPERDFSDVQDRDEGVIGESGGTYVMVYDTSTPEEPRTATFTLDGANLEFSTTLPYRASNIRQSHEDPISGITHYLFAMALMYEEYFGSYIGSHAVMAMGSEVVYTYTITLGAGKAFDFISEFEMGGTPYDYTETGMYDIDGTVLTLQVWDPADEVYIPVVGTLDDGEIEIAVKASAMAARETRTLMFATHNEWAGTYLGYRYVAMGGTVMTNAIATLELDNFGNYMVEVDNLASAEPTAIEEGTYDVVGGVITFTPEGESASVGTLQNFYLVGNFKIPGDMDPTERREFKFYNDILVGEFTATAELGEAGLEKEYTVILTLTFRGEFELHVEDEDEVVYCDEDGTFTTSAAMGLLYVDLDMVDAPNIIVSAAGLSINIVIDPPLGEDAIGFLLTKE